MRPKHLYLGLCVLGTVLPYSQLVPFLQEHGLQLRLMVQQLFANRISAFFGLAVIVAAVEAIPVEDVVRILDAHGMLKR